MLSKHVVVALGLLALEGCGDEDLAEPPGTLLDPPHGPIDDDTVPPPDDGDMGRELDIAVCDLSAGPFSLTIDNPFFPLIVGGRLTLAGEDDHEQVVVVATVLDETEEVGGVMTRVLEERETIDGELAEVSRNYFAQAPDGTVCYFGEAVDIFEDGQVSHDGAWRADDEGNQPGIIMPAHPRIGDSYQQEVAPGIAEDHATIVGVNERFAVPAGSFTETLFTEEDSPLEPGSISEKVYAADVGLIFDDGLELQPY